MAPDERRGIASDPRKGRHLFGSAMRLAVSALLLAYIINRIGWTELVGQGQHLRGLLLVVPLSLVGTKMLVRAGAWTILLRASGARVRYTNVLFSYWVGTFAGVLVPIGFGIDLARVVTLNRRSGISAHLALATAVALNVLGLAALLLLALVGASWLSYSTDPAIPILPIFASLLALIAVVVAFQRWWTSRSQASRERSPEPVHGLSGHIERVLSSLAVFNGNWRLMLFALAAAIIIRLLSILTAFTTAVAFGFSIPLLLFIAYMPLIALARYLPISVGGFGGEQNLFVLLFGMGGIDAAEALTVSLAYSTIVALITLTGGLSYMADILRGVFKAMRSTR